MARARKRDAGTGGTRLPYTTYAGGRCGADIGADREVDRDEVGDNFPPRLALLPQDQNCSKSGGVSLETG